jgi:hypothetical protein
MSLNRICTLLLFSALAHGQQASKVWVADNGDGTFKNPVLHADYSDPDLVRVRSAVSATAPIARR